MFKAGYAQEVITPPVGVDLAGYFNVRLNQGAYDDLYAKAIAMEANGKQFAFLTLDLCHLHGICDFLEEAITKEFGADMLNNIIFSCIHTHTGPRIPTDKSKWDDRTKEAACIIANGAVRALKRAFMNLLPAELEATKVYNNPYANIRRYWMTDGNIVTNPGWRNPNIVKPESELDRTIGIVAVKQNGRIAALMCNIANHVDTIGGSIVSADWPGRLTQEIQHELKASIPVLIVDDASGDVNHFDFRQDINQTSYNEATRIGRGYARIILDALPDLKPLDVKDVVIKNKVVDVPHRQITDEEYKEAIHTLETVPDIKKEGDFESQDLANKVPAALRYFAQRVLDCKAKSKPSHKARFTSIALGKEIIFVTLPGEPFNGIGRAIRAKSDYKNTIIISLAQSVAGYTPMKECFERGGYEVQAAVDSAAQNASDVLIEAATSLL